MEIKSRFITQRAILGLGIAISSFLLAGSGLAQDPPTYRVDMSWPKELPNNWIMGQVGGMAVDRHDNVWRN